MLLVVRTVTYASLFIGIVLVYLPGHLLSWSGIVRPAAIELEQVAGMAIGGVGAVVALWCILTFISVGKGTPAPFDPPRRLVTKGPYQLVRNPMYIGTDLVLAGAALFYESMPLLGYAVLFALVAHILVVLYEEPSLRRTFGKEYDAYYRLVRRWWPQAPRCAQ
jgi:protein-S-isoprenylcysteine O-methyltransferase Ste14